MSFYLYRIKPRWTIDPPFFILSIYDDEFVSAQKELYYIRVQKQKKQNPPWIGGNIIFVFFCFYFLLWAQTGGNYSGATWDIPPVGVFKNPHIHYTPVARCCVVKYTGQENCLKHCSNPWPMDYKPNVLTTNLVVETTEDEIFRTSEHQNIHHSKKANASQTMGRAVPLLPRLSRLPSLP